MDFEIGLWQHPDPHSPLWGGGAHAHATFLWEKDLTELCHDNDNEFLVKTIENVEEKLHFLSFLVKN
jgi:hypothetical protein